MTIQTLASKASKFVADNSPAILTSVGVAGVVGTAVLTGRAMVKADHILQEAENESLDIDNVHLARVDKFKLVWTLYIPPVLSAGFTIVAIVGANRIGTRRAAAMAAAYSLSEKAFEEYREKVVEKFTERKEHEVRDEIAQDHVTRNPNSNREVLITNDGSVLCYDKMSGRYFESDMESIKKAQNDTNYLIMSVDGYASLNDFYDKLGLDRIPIGEEVGWNSDKMLDIYFSTIMSDNQKPCIAIDFHTMPIRNYFRTH